MTRTLRRLIPLLMAVLMAIPCADAAKPRRKQSASKPQTTRSLDKVKSEQKSTRASISETTSKIKANEKELDKKLGELNSLNADIESQTATVNRLRSHVDSIGSAIIQTTDSIATLEGNLESLRRAYASALVRLQPTAGSLDAINFIFSASSFTEAWSRLRYLRRFSEWRKSKVRDINTAVDRIAERRSHLTALRHDSERVRRAAEQQQQVLQSKQSKQRSLVASLRKEDSRLRSRLAEQQKRAAALDRELDRLIAEEQKRIAREEAERKKREQKASGSKSTAASGTASSGSNAVSKAAATSPSSLTGSFESNKGRLLFPVAGNYRIVRRFGRQPHPTLPHVTVDNSGIDIETASGASARAVYAGTVSAIFAQEGFGSIVMLRHGNYLTVYAGLASVNVSKGQSVKAGQSIGSVAPDPTGSGGLLHFEVRNERTKLNPTAWVK